MRKNKRPELSQVVEDIYDAALDSARWKDTIATIAHYVGGQAGGLALKDCQSKNLNVFYDVGFDPECIEVYLATYSRFDPLATAPLFDARRVANVPDLMPYDEYLNGRFYREWAQPHGWLDSANAIIERSGTSSTLLRIVTRKNTGLVDDNMRGRMAQVVPHVRRATLVGKSMDLKHAEAAMLAETLDGLSAGLVLVDAKARVVHANEAARDLLEAGDFLRSIDGRLMARDAEINQTLRDIFAIAGGGDAALGNRGIALTVTAHDGERYALHVLPLSSGDRRRAGIAYAAVAAMFVRKASLQAPSSAEAIGRTYRLTRTELRVLLAVVELESLSEAAQVLGIADTTVKFHLGNIYAKTGAHRVTGLIKLMAGLSNPLLD
ncbi:MAG TPA: LuxR C-terminal-related transcriptional regulator [Methyloceanibacter sp.]|nr:LuxR C-terminal-related transcriptional regulator [Methyloceanibacter sp.]